MILSMAGGKYDEVELSQVAVEIACCDTAEAAQEVLELAVAAWICSAPRTRS